MFAPSIDIYNRYDYISDNINIDFMKNRLFTSFTNFDGISELVMNIANSYNVIYNKIFVLKIVNEEEYAVTYNIEEGNINNIPSGTILVHRKKDSNTLYTINALNELIKKLNGGQLNSNYPINWNEYKNSIMLTQHGEFKLLNTKIYKIIDL